MATSGLATYFTRAMKKDTTGGREHADIRNNRKVVLPPPPAAARAAGVHQPDAAAIRRTATP